MSDPVDGSNGRAFQRPRTRGFEEAEPADLTNLPQLTSRRRGMRLLARKWQADDSDDEVESDDELDAPIGHALLRFSARASIGRSNYKQSVGNATGGNADAAELNHRAAIERAETAQHTSFNMVMWPRLSERSASTSWGYANILSRDKTSEVIAEIETGRSGLSSGGFVSPARAFWSQKSVSSQGQLKAISSTSHGKAANARAKGLCEPSSSEDDGSAKIGDSRLNARGPTVIGGL